MASRWRLWTPSDKRGAVSPTPGAVMYVRPSICPSTLSSRRPPWPKRGIPFLSVVFEYNMNSALLIVRYTNTQDAMVVGMINRLTHKLLLAFLLLAQIFFLPRGHLVLAHPLGKVA